MLANNVPSQIYIGVPAKKSEKFNDGLQLTKEGGLTKINAIKVFYTDKHVVGVTVYYKLADGDYLKARHNSPEKGNKKLQRRLFEIGPDDYLSEVSGHLSEKGITRLTFQTYRGKIGTYGSDEGVPFLHSFDGYTFGAFSGGFKDYLQHLEIIVYPVPNSFLEELRRPVTVKVTVVQQAPPPAPPIRPFPIQQPQPVVQSAPPSEPIFKGFYVPTGNNSDFAKVDNFGQGFPQPGQGFPQPGQGFPQPVQATPFFQVPTNAPIVRMPPPPPVPLPSANNPSPFSSKYPEFK